MNRLPRQVMMRFDEADRPAAGAHDDGMRNGDGALHTDALEQRAFRNAGGYEDDVFAAGEILGHELVLEHVAPPLGEERLTLLSITRPDFRAHAPAEAAQ